MTAWKEMSGEEGEGGRTQECWVTTYRRPRRVKQGGEGEGGLHLRVREFRVVEGKGGEGRGA